MIPWAMASMLWHRKKSHPVPLRCWSQLRRPWHTQQTRQLTPALAILPPSANLDKLHIIFLCEPILQPGLLELALEVVDVRDNFGPDDIAEHVQGELEAFQSGLVDQS